MTLTHTNPFPPFLLHFVDLPDPRWKRYQLHNLQEMLVILFLAVLCGAKGWEDIENFGLAKQEWLRQSL